MKKTDIFSQWTPLDLTKSKDDDGALEIEGIASSESVDESGEIILQSGLDFSYALKKGVFNLEHLSGPKNVLGHPSEIFATSVNGKKATGVKGILYTKKKEVAEIIETAKAMKSAGGGRTLGFSIEGSVLARDPRNPKIITKAKVLNISITSSPCNTDATMKLVKSIMSEMTDEELEGVNKNMYKDNEYHDKPMSLKQAKMAAEYGDKLVRLLELMPDEVDLPEWIQSKITKSLDYLQVSYHYLDVESKEMMREYKSYKDKYEKMLEEKEMPQPEEGEPTPEAPGIQISHEEDNDYQTQDKPYLEKEEGSLAPIVEESLEGKKDEDEDDDKSMHEMASEDYSLSKEEMKELAMRILREFPELSNEELMAIIHQYIKL